MRRTARPSLLAKTKKAEKKGKLPTKPPQLILDAPPSLSPPRSSLSFSLFLATMSATEAMCAARTCQTSATQSCGRCKVVKYCGRDCQRSHWKAHRDECADWAKLAENGFDLDDPEDAMQVRPQRASQRSGGGARKTERRERERDRHEAKVPAESVDLCPLRCPVCQNGRCAAALWSSRATCPVPSCRPRLRVCRGAGGKGEVGGGRREAAASWSCAAASAVSFSSASLFFFSL